MLRYLVVILFILNITFFGWVQGWFGEKPNQNGHEPQRLVAQIRPEAIEVVSVYTTPTPSPVVENNNATDPTPIPMSPEDEENTSVHTTTATQSAQEAPAPQQRPSLQKKALTLYCLESGPLDAAQANSLQLLVAKLLPEEAWEMGIYTAASSWAVYIGPMESEKIALTRKAELASIGVVAELNRNKAQYQPGLTLGLFREQANAQRLLTRSNDKGVTDAHIVAWTYTPIGQLLRVLRANKSQWKNLNAMSIELHAPEFKPCDPENNLS